MRFTNLWFTLTPAFELATPSPLSHVFRAPGLPKDINRIIEEYALPVYPYSTRDGLSFRGIPSVICIRFHIKRSTCFRANVEPAVAASAIGSQIPALFRNVKRLRFERISAAHVYIAAIPRKRRCVKRNRQS